MAFSPTQSEPFDVNAWASSVPSSPIPSAISDLSDFAEIENDAETFAVPEVPNSNQQPHVENQPTPEPQASSSEHSAMNFHPLFFMREDMVEIIVEDTAFRIPSIWLTQHSTYFKKLFEERMSHGSQGRLHLDESVRTNDFVNLLRILNTPKFEPTPLHKADDWASVLRLSTKWDFRAVRFMAIENLAHVASPVEKIVLARSCNVDNWLMEAYLALCRRPEALTLDEARLLLLEDVVRISEARHAGLQLSSTLQNTASETQNYNFHYLFPDVPADDRLVEDYICGFDGVGKLLGRLYVTRNRVCFHENFAGRITHEVIPFEDITGIEKKMQSLFIPGAIHISTHKGRNMFVSFTIRDASFDVIYAAWLEFRIKKSLRQTQ